MARKYKEIGQGKFAVVDIKCDMCGDSCRTLEGYEVATLAASFNEGPHTGDRFVIEFCQHCFDEILHHVIVECMGTCLYHSEINGVDMDIDDLRELYAHMGAGTLVFDEEDTDPEEPCED